MATDGATDLPSGWPDAFDDEARDYLYEEGRQRLAESIEFGNQQEAKALALLRISLIIIAASGIFGDLQVDLASVSPLDWSLITQASVLAILFSTAVGGLAFWILHPRAWHTGADVEWLAHWSGARARDLKGATLDALLEGFVANNEVTRERGDRLVWLLWAVAIQTVCVVFVQVAAAAESLAGSGG